MEMQIGKKDITNQPDYAKSRYFPKKQADIGKSHSTDPYLFFASSTENHFDRDSKRIKDNHNDQ